MISKIYIKSLVFMILNHSEREPFVLAHESIKIQNES